MKLIKKIIITALIMAVYVGCVMWIYEGIKLEPSDKFLICWFGACSLGLSIGILNINEIDI